MTIEEARYTIDSMRRAKTRRTASKSIPINHRLRCKIISLRSIRVWAATGCQRLTATSPRPLKVKRTIESLRSAVNDALAGAKRDAALIHTTIAENRAAVGDDTHHIPDFVAACTTKPEIFASLGESRRLAAEAKANAVPAKPTAQAAAQSSVVTPAIAVTPAANDIPTVSLAATQRSGYPG